MKQTDRQPGHFGAELERITGKPVRVVRRRLRADWPLLAVVVLALLLVGGVWFAYKETFQ